METTYEALSHCETWHPQYESYWKVSPVLDRCDKQWGWQHYARSSAQNSWIGIQLCTDRTLLGSSVTSSEKLYCIKNSSPCWKCHRVEVWFSSKTNLMTDVHCEISISAVDKKNLVSEYVLDWCCIYWLKDDLTNIYYKERDWSSQLFEWWPQPFTYWWKIKCVTAVTLVSTATTAPQQPTTTVYNKRSY